jgi:signal recognition particle receptor subunit beta
MGLGKIRGAEVRLHLYTVPGHVKYRSTRKMVLRGVDGLVFVADSMEVQRRLNMESLRDLQQNLKDYGMSIYKIPIVLQFNKRDLAKGGPSIMSLEQMERELNGQLKVPAFPASAIKGEGIGATLKKCLELTLGSLQKELHWGA